MGSSRCASVAGWGRPGSSRLRELPAAAGPIRLEDIAAYYHAMDLVRPVDQPHGACDEVHRPERRQVGESERAVDLDRAVDHVVQHARGVELYERDLDPRLVARVESVRRLERQ